jgi:predicted nucleic acid-binding protein
LVQASPVVADASVLIAFSEIEFLDLLKSLFQDLIVPPAVVKEVMPTLGGIPDWITEIRPSRVHEAASRLDAGEREALSLAIELSASKLLIGDLRGRRVAEQLHVPIVGSVGILLAAKEQGHIENVRPHMDAMRKSSLYLKDAVYVGILRAAGEA